MWKDLDELGHGKGGEVFGIDSALLCLSEEQQSWSFLINKPVSLVFRVLGIEPGALCYQASLLPLSYAPVLLHHFYPSRWSQLFSLL